MFFLLLSILMPQHLQSSELFGKDGELRVLGALLDVVSERDDFKDILFLQVIILLQIIEESLLVANKVVELEMIMHLLKDSLLFYCTERIPFEKLELVAVFSYFVT